MAGFFRQWRKQLEEAKAETPPNDMVVCATCRRPLDWHPYLRVWVHKRKTDHHAVPEGGAILKEK
jgi:hypothetical protein